MDLKKKFKLFISDIKDSGNRQANLQTSPEQLVDNPAVSKYKPDYEGAPLRDPHADREAIDSIEKQYFTSSSGFDAGQHELLKIVEKMDRQAISENERKLRRQLEAVSRKVSELVLAHHPDFASELQKVMELGVQLTEANGVCYDSRSKLAASRHIFTNSSLGLLASMRRRQQLIVLLKSFATIKTLLKTDVRLREMVEEENYAGAIQLCQECKKAAETFRQYQCISELNSKLADTLEMIEEALDVALSRSCTTFDQTYYAKVQLAYRYLGKTQTSIDQLLMHYSTAILNTAFTKVLGYVELCAGSGAGNFQKRQYQELCQNITADIFIPCLTDLCKALWEVMKCYRQTMQWHQQNTPTEQDASGSASSSSNSALSSNVYVQQKLEAGQSRVWGDIQQKVKTYLISFDMSHFKYDEFISVLNIVNRLIQVGEEFCGSKSESLQDSVRKQSLNYFKAYHTTKLDELRMFLENECWELCPVKQTFSVFMLQEFRFLRPLIDQTSNKVNLSSIQQVPNQKQSQVSFFEQNGTPFDLRLIEDDAEDLLDVSSTVNNTSSGRLLVTPDTDSDDEIPDELKQDVVDEKTGEPQNSRIQPAADKKKKKKKPNRSVSNKSAPIVTNTTLEVCRRIGSYMQMMNALKPIAYDVVTCLTQLFDYYLFSIYAFFAAYYDGNSEDINDRYLSNRSRATLKRIRDNLIVQAANGNEEGAGGVGSAGAGVGAVRAPAADQQDRVPAPHLSPIVNLTRPESLFGLNERIVAMESLIFLAEQFEFLQPHLESMVPLPKKAFLQQFYSQTVNTAQELRRPVYRASVSRAINADQLVLAMQNIKWDIHELMSQHSPYVDVLLQELSTFHTQLSFVSKNMPIPKVVNDVLWEHCIRTVNRGLVEGFGSAKKCSNEGRALMQLDFQQLVMKLEKLSELRPVPDREYVESYIKAFYLPEDQLETFIRDHKEYSVRQMLSLVSCMGHLNKRTRQKLTSMLEESVEKARRQ